ncbi:MULTISPECIES: hypothetical protein [Pedobacter]|uniref:DUF4296 domain-containing protein n=1 Tax=Pedobacter agri TaxID=454586 RepID=A0A9X3IBL4_9SPHI|nr:MULTISPECIES: hypothetical protein [Pedobacter]AZI27365.1 hypothetical protein EA772_19230 [Pedobacter sp. G11]MCX3267535.1 hypothetical protein [Pedobacter agri]MDQ1139093.1 hypothetical protein [Pedobacter agri]
MKFILLLMITLLGIGCHNTNPEQGAGGIKVDKPVTLSNDAIVDSTRALIDQKYALRKKLSEGKITEAAFNEQNTMLNNTFKVLFNSLSPADTLKIASYQKEKAQDAEKDSIKSNKAPRWE